MAHYAFLNTDNVVTEVIVGVDEDEVLEGQDPETWYGQFRGQPCVRTSYNTRAGQHVYGGTPFRGNYAGIGMVFLPDAGPDGIFVEQQPYPSWTLDEATASWQPPAPMPTEGRWYWDEPSLSWVELPPLS